MIFISSESYKISLNCWVFAKEDKFYMLETSRNTCIIDSIFSRGMENIRTIRISRVI